MTGVPPVDAFFDALCEVDQGAAVSLVLDLLDDGVPASGITRDVLAPAQVRVGEMWEQGEWSVADEHAATAITETALTALATARPSPRRTDGGPHVLVACAEGEWHALPPRMVSEIARDTGVRLSFTGPSLPAEHLARRLRAGDVHVLALSCTMPTNLLGALRCIDAAHDAGVPVIVGGRAFGADPRRAEVLGGDRWALDPASVAVVPGLTRRTVTPPAEALLLDAVGDRELAVAFARLVEAYPALAAMTPFQVARTKEDLRWMARFAGAAVLTDDQTVLDDMLQWLARLLGQRVPPAVLAASARVVAETVEADAPAGAARLHAAADTLAA